MSIEVTGGWIYVLMSSSNYNKFKIGRSRRNPMDRIKDVRVGDQGIGLLTAYFVPSSVGALSRVEAAIHDQFGGRLAFHDESLSEWFEGSPDWACQWIEAVVEDWRQEPVASISSLGSGRICRAYESDLAGIYEWKPGQNHLDGLPM